MKYAIAAACDQTITYLKNDLSETVKPSEAFLWEDKEEIDKIVERLSGAMTLDVEEVEDEQEFRLRPDTWETT